MPQAQPSVRRFSFHACHVDRHHARVVQEPSFEAAAVAYLEDFHLETGDEPEIRVIVHELETGHEHCFTVDLESGETAPCG